jgi:hypothetical protein
VLDQDAEDTAAFLREHPGQWYLVASGPLSRAGVIKQTAWRIRKGDLRAFPVDESGRYEAATTAARDRPDAVAEVEMVARWVPAGHQDDAPPADDQIQRTSSAVLSTPST